MTDFRQLSPQDIANIIVWHRKRGKLNQQSLAQMAGISRTALQRIEAGHNYTIENLLSVFNVLNLQMRLDGPLMSLFLEEAVDEA